MGIQLATEEIPEKVELKNCIVLEIEKYHPESVSQLITLVRKRTQASDKRIMNCIIELQNENKVVFEQMKPTGSEASRKTFLLKNGFGHWASFLLVLLALNGFLALSSSFSYLIYFRYIFAFILVLFLPGFTFLRLICGSKMVINSNLKMDYVEKFGLSVGMSMVVVPMVGLVLNYTPWGISFESLVTSLFIVTTSLIIGSELRERIEIRVNIINVNIKKRLSKYEIKKRFFV